MAAMNGGTPEGVLRPACVFLRLFASLSSSGFACASYYHRAMIFRVACCYCVFLPCVGWCRLSLSLVTGCCWRLLLVVVIAAMFPRAQL